MEKCLFNFSVNFLELTNSRKNTSQDFVKSYFASVMLLVFETKQHGIFSKLLSV